MKFLIILITILSAVSAIIFQKEWDDFKAKYKKIYQGYELLPRYNFVINKLRIDVHNQRHDRNLVKYRLGINQNSDLNQLQYFESLGGSPRLQIIIPTPAPITTPPTTLPSDPAFPIPNSIDYRSYGALTEVKDQSTHCNCAWAFAAVAAIESRHFLQYTKLPPALSVQNLLDCGGGDGKSLCNGVQTPKSAFEYVERNQNINSETAYPYTGVASKICRYNPNELGANLGAFEEIKDNDDRTLRDIVGVEGPVVIGFNPFSFEFQHYESGVFEPPRSFYDLTMSRYYMLVVGYGRDEKLNTDYWILRNSMGPEWGEAGYMRVERRTDKPITKSAIYPLV